MFLSFKGNKDNIFLVFCIITTLKLSLINLWSLFKKCFNLISLSSQYGISMDMKVSAIPNKFDSYKTFISIIFTPMKLINYTVNETWWVISLHKLLSHQNDFFIQVWWNSFWTIKIAIDCISFIAFWILEIHGDARFILFW